MSVKTDRVCDRCGKSIGINRSILSRKVPIHIRLTRVLGFSANDCYDFDYDLCADRTDSFDKWIKEGHSHMTREILFRGFRPCEDGNTTIYVEGKAVKGQWVEGDLVHSKSGFVFVKDPSTHCEYGLWENGHYCGNHIVDKVLPSTVCQYTGLTDKNGRKIFEGDIVKTNDILYKNEIQTEGKELYVLFLKGSFVLLYKDTDFYSYIHTAEKISVIGNIHDQLKK